MIKFSFAISILARLYALAGRRDDAIRMLNELKELSRRSYVSPSHFIWVYAGLGDLEAWRQALRDAYEERSNWIIFIVRAGSLFDPIRSDPVFQEILGKLHLPDTQ